MDSNEQTHSGGTDEYIDKNKGIENHGDIINGKYVLIKKIGYGTFSIVWLAYLLDVNIQEYEKKFFAIKVYHPEYSDEGNTEISIINSLLAIHLPMVPMHETLLYTPLNNDSKLQSVCLVFDIMTCSVKNLLSMKQYENGLPESVVLHIIEQVTRTLLQLQDNGILYTDVRPENIMIKTNNDQLEQFCRIFYDLHHDDRWIQKCASLCEEHKINVINKSHRTKFAKIKRKYSKKLIRTISNDIDESVSEISRNVQISETMPVIVIDFNNAFKNEKKNNNYCVQSRNYKAPEIILHIPYTYKIDVWSLACTMYELLTGEYLFDPEGTRTYSTDYNHIYWMVELLGQMPKHMTREANTNERYFYSNGTFNIEIDEKDWSLEKSFEKDDTIISDSTLQLLKDMLIYDPKLRISFGQILDRIESIKVDI